MSARSDAYELVAILRGERLLIYLDRLAGNEPVTDAKIAVTIGDAVDAEQATATADGAFAVSSPRFRTAGAVELVFAIATEANEDLLVGTLTVPPDATVSPPSWLATIQQWLAWLFSSTGSTARPAEGGNAAAAIVATDSPRRLPDGHVFVPKPTQRLLEVRTRPLAPQSAQRAVNLIGRVIADPNRTSLVQSINGGRIMAPDTGLPRIGQKVAKGDVLARIEPALPQADRTTILEKLGEVEQLIAVAETRLRRARVLADKQVVPQSQVADAEIELEGLRRRRQVLSDIRIEPEVLRAQTSGVIAASRVVPGQVVQAQDVLFQIVDPASLWVEALVYGEIDPATLSEASAAVAGRPPLALRFQGFSHALQQQATLVQFAIVDPPDNMPIGLPVTVVARSGEAETALMVPKDAVVRSANGESIVWRHEAAELFEPRPVRVLPFDAARVVVADGVAPGDRVVVRAADLVNQVR
ncbi:MAG: efflux RND transporter periplasmic adaptor subunit [Hyphomicrobiales bacterium]|nr:efflux RND transporter periplasmic adaptor subunit [Hyphomicrobiales bacterium]